MTASPAEGCRAADAVNGEGGQALPYADWKAQGKSRRRNLRKKLGLLPGDAEQAHHIIPVADPRAEYLREILYQCGMDLNDVENGVPLTPKEHARTYTKFYFNALDIMFNRHDPDKNISPCEWLSDDSEHGLRAMLKRIKNYLKTGTFPY
jgi:A nuclease family of the HNH/ENDO VII superfamily with conserved AHH